MMKAWAAALAAAVVLTAGAAWGLTADEVLRLKKAGVSDAVIQKMLEQEAAGGAPGDGNVTRTEDSVTYRAGQQTKDRLQRNREHERWKEEQSMKALGGMVIDSRPYEAGQQDQGE